jgi:hypothetical protein
MDEVHIEAESSAPDCAPTGRVTFALDSPNVKRIVKRAMVEAEVSLRESMGAGYPRSPVRNAGAWRRQMKFQV